MLDKNEEIKNVFAFSQSQLDLFKEFHEERLEEIDSLDAFV
jgi:hypothetical protein